MNQPNDKHSNYLTDRILNTQRAALKVEEDWLKSINASVKRLPKHVAEAVATRMLMSALPLEFAAKLEEDAEAIKILKQLDS